MGQAKRRRDAELSMEHEAIDHNTGRTYQVRAAGITPQHLLAEWKQLTTGDRRSTSVPCNGCRACCYWHRVDVIPEQESADDLAHLSLAQDEKGLYLQKRADGACIHLDANGCSVYAHRPKACRFFDCRVFGLIHSTPAIGKLDGPLTPLWIFRIDTPEDRAIIMAANMGMSSIVAALSTEGRLPKHDEVLLAITNGIKQYLPKARQIVAKLNSLPKAELDAIVAQGKEAIAGINYMATKAMNRT